MSLFGNIEKLITEHGSAAVLRERITLAQEKYVALEKKLADVKEDHAKELKQLKADHAKEIEELKSRLAPAAKRRSKARRKTRATR
jgi:gas vesicle protein